MAGVSDDDLKTIHEQFPFDSGALPVRYLGLPLMTKRMTVHDYNPLLEKIRRKISCWTARHLSFAGRLQLIGSVIHSLTNFWISAFRLPKSCLTEIDKLCVAFLWSGPELNSKKAKIAWSEVCKPKTEGGLGLRPVSEANKVSCLKLIWRILAAHSSLWVNWVRRYLIRKGSFWNVKNNSSLGSWMWRKLLKYREIAKTFVKVDIRNGATTSFWHDIWTSRGRLIDITGARGCIELGIHNHATVEMVLQTHRSRRHRMERYTIVEEVIKEQRQKGITHEDDVFLWRKKGDSFQSKFDSKATWKLIRDGSPIQEWWKGIWFTYATPKYAFHSWLVFHNRLSTGDRMIKWNIGVDGSCVLCQRDMETRNHLYFTCRYSEEVWCKLTRNLLRSKYTTDWGRIVELLLDISQDKTLLFLLRYAFQTTLYTIWRERNNRRHGEASITASKLAQIIDKQIRNRLSSIREMGDSRYEGGMEAWFASR